MTSTASEACTLRHIYVGIKIYKQYSLADFSWKVILDTECGWFWGLRDEQLRTKNPDGPSNTSNDRIVVLPPQPSLTLI